MNNLLELFCGLRAAQGWEVERAIKAESLAQLGNRRLRKAKMSLEQQKIADLMSARQLTDQEFRVAHELAERGKSMDRDQQFAYEKALLERSLGVELSPEIIELNKKGKLLDQMGVFAFLKGKIHHDALSQIATHLSSPKTAKRLDKTSIKELTAVVAHLCVLVRNGEIDPSAAVSQETLGGFVRFCTYNKTIIEEITGYEVRKDIDKMAIKQLEILLEFAGLKLVFSARRTVDGVQTREYRLDPRRLRLMSELASGYRPIESSLSTSRSTAA